MAIGKIAGKLVGLGKSTKGHEYVDVRFKPPLNEVRERFKERLDELGGGSGRGFSVPNKKASIFLDRWVQKNFRTSGSFVGGWLPFKRGGRWISGTKKKAGHLDTSAKLLMDTGRLRMSFLPFYNKRDAGIGSDLFYSKLHHKGNPKRGLPERRLLPLHSEVDRDLWTIYSTHVAMLTREKVL